MLVTISFGDYERSVDYKRANFCAREYMPWIKDTRCRVCVIRYERLRKNGEFQQKQHVFRVLDRGIFCIDPLHPDARQWLAQQTLVKFFKKSTKRG